MVFMNNLRENRSCRKRGRFSFAHVASAMMRKSAEPSFQHRSRAGQSCVVLNAKCGEEQFFLRLRRDQHRRHTCPPTKILSRLQSIDISEAYAKAIENGRCDGKGGLSPRTVHHMHRVLFKALKQAKRWKLITNNPAGDLEKQDRPKIEKKAVTAINAPTLAEVFDAARERRLFIPLILAALCGLRRGEITALRWRAIDLDNGQLAVVASTEQTDAGEIREKEAKSGKTRTIALPSLAIEELQRWKLAQAQELLKLGVRADDSWQSSPGPMGNRSSHAALLTSCRSF